MLPAEAVAVVANAIETDVTINGVTRTTVATVKKPAIETDHAANQLRTLMAKADADKTAMTSLEASDADPRAPKAPTFVKIANPSLPKEAQRKSAPQTQYPSQPQPMPNAAASNGSTEPRDTGLS
jgi:hypothetical protein